MRALIARYDMLPPGALVLCAVSGGADSMCLLHLLRSLAPELGFSLAAAHFNHHLRGSESLRDENFVRARCEEWGVPLVCGSGDVQGEAADSGRGIEETARELRYAFLERAAGELGAARIATAHTADDNAETLLLRLVRGTGLQGLTGIPPRRGKIVRPLLAATRAQVEAYCAEFGVPYVEDSSNGDENYTRNFLRLRVIPLLEQVNPRAVEHMSAAAHRLRADHDCLCTQAVQCAQEAQMTNEGLAIRAKTLAELPDPVAVRALRMLLERAGGGRNCSAAHLRALLELCRGDDPSAAVDLPGLTVHREYGTLVFAPGRTSPQPPTPVPVGEGTWTVFGNTGWALLCRRTVCPEKNFKNPDTFFLSCDKIKGSLCLRTRRAGDTLQLPGRPDKRLKKLMIEEKIPRSRRELLPVLSDDAGVLAVAGLGPHVSRLALPGTPALEIQWKIEKE